MSFAVVNDAAKLLTEHLAYHCVAGVFLTQGYLALTPIPNPTP